MWLTQRFATSTSTILLTKAIRTDLLPSDSEAASSLSLQPSAAQVFLPACLSACQPNLWVSQMPPRGLVSWERGIHPRIMTPIYSIPSPSPTTPGKTCLLHLLTLLIFCVSAASKPKPNIVIILTDDQVLFIIIWRNWNIIDIRILSWVEQRHCLKPQRFYEIRAHNFQSRCFVTTSIGCGFSKLHSFPFCILTNYFPSSVLLWQLQSVVQVEQASSLGATFTTRVRSHQQTSEECPSVND